jgi:phage-related protein
MSEPILSVRFFRTEAGNEPVRDFLHELPSKDRKIIGTDIKEVQFGWPLGMPLVRKIERDLWEIRSHVDGRIVRILFTVLEGQMVLLHAFIKKSQKTPGSDLDAARARKSLLSGGTNEKQTYRQ